MPGQAFLQQVVNNFLEYVFVLDMKTEIVFQSGSTENLFGFTNEEINEQGFGFLFIAPSSLDICFTRAKQDGTYICTENMRHKTKPYINIAYRVYHKKDPETQTHYLVFYLKDNSQQNLVRKDILRKTLTIENLSKSRKIRDGKIEEAIFEILASSSRAVHTTRVNAWIFDERKTQIQCIGNFDTKENKLVPQTALPRLLMPGYFNLFETEKIIITTDTLKDKKTAELYDIYLKPNDIQSLMDIPVRIEGEMIGVICFEHVGSPREWTLQEQKFGLVAAQMLSLTIESHNKQKVRQALELSLKEKTVLLQEVHHRVKNNLSIVASLMNLQSEKSKDNYHRQLFMESRNRIDSIVAVHELIYRAKTYSELNFKDYMDQIIGHISSSFKTSTKVKIVKKMMDVHIDICCAIPMALIVNEIITNAYKHAFNNRIKGIIDITLFESKDKVSLIIQDNGRGFDKRVVPENSIGMDILNGLVEQISGILKLTSNNKGTCYKISFSKNKSHF